MPIDGLWKKSKFQDKSGIWYRSRPQAMKDFDAALDVAHAAGDAANELKAILNLRTMGSDYLRSRGSSSDNRKTAVTTLVGQIEGLLTGPYQAAYLAQRDAKIRRAGQRFAHITGIRIEGGEVVRDKGLKTVSNHEYVAEVVDTGHRAGRYFDQLRTMWEQSDTVLSLEDWLQANQDQVGLAIAMGGRQALTRAQVAMLPAANRPAIAAGAGFSEEVTKAVVHLDAVGRRDFELVLGAAGYARPVDGGTPFDSANHSTGAEAGLAGWSIFVCSPDLRLYTNSKVTNFFHHSSFLGGGPVKGAGCLKVTNGRIEKVNCASGHYKPGPKQLWNTLDAIFRHHKMRAGGGARGIQAGQQALQAIQASEAYATNMHVGPYYDAYKYWASGGTEKVQVADAPAAPGPVANAS